MSYLRRKKKRIDSQIRTKNSGYTCNYLKINDGCCISVPSLILCHLLARTNIIHIISITEVEVTRIIIDYNIIYFNYPHAVAFVRLTQEPLT